MGYNTTVVVMNDALGAIKTDESFGANLHRACLEVMRGEPVDIASKGYVNAATVLESHHADHLATVLVGGNTGYLIEGWLDYRDHKDESLLRMLADRLGYKLVRKGR
jgi:hypothetical protein